MAKSLDAAKKEQQQPQDALLKDPQAWPTQIIICAGRQDWDGAILHHLTASEAEARRQIREWSEQSITGVYRVIQTPHAARQIVVLNEAK